MAKLPTSSAVPELQAQIEDVAETVQLDELRQFRRLAADTPDESCDLQDIWEFAREHELHP